MSSTLHLARLITECDGIVGRKKLQKIVHLLQVAGYRSQFSYDFGYLHYGPYSHGVKQDLDLLTREELVREEPDSAGEHTTFRYVPDSGLSKALDSVGIESSPAWGSMAKRLNGMSPQQLESASTIAYLRERGFESNLLYARFLELKPSLDHFYNNASNLVNELQATSDLRR